MQDDHLKNPRYVNWVKTSLSLLYLKEGVTSFSEEKAGELHNAIAKDVGLKTTKATTAKCNKCIPKSVTKTKTKDKKKKTWTMHCTANICNVWLEEILHYHEHFPLPNISWENSNPQLWPSDVWEVAKLFQPFGCETHRKAEDSDCSSLLTMMLKCTFFHKFFSNKAILQKVKDIRNECMHSGSQEIDDQTTAVALTTMVTLLEEQGLRHRQECITAITKIEKLRDNDLDISFSKELHILALNNKIAEMRTDMNRKFGTLTAQQASTDEDFKQFKKTTNEEIQALQSTVAALESKQHDPDNQKAVENEKEEDITQSLDSQVQLAKRGLSKNRCHRHKDKSIECYCKGHGQLCCETCNNVYHKTCTDVLYIPDVASNLENIVEYKQVQNQLSDILTKSEKVNAVSKEQTTSLEDNFGIVTKQMGDFRQKILSVWATAETANEASELNATSSEDSCANDTEIKGSSRQDIIDALDKIYIEIEKMLTVIKCSVVKQIVTVTEKAKDVAQELEAIKNKIDGNAQHCELFIEMMRLKNKLNSIDAQLEELDDEQAATKYTIQFSQNADCLDNLMKAKSFGELSLVERKERDMRKIIRAVHTHDIHLESEDDQKQDCFITGFALLPNDILIVSDHRNFKVMTVDLKQHSVVEKRILNSMPFDIVKITDNQVAVTLPYEEKIVFLTVGTGITVDRELPVGHCNGLAYKEGKLAVTFSILNQIKVMDLTGTVTQTFSSANKGFERFINPCYVMFSRDKTQLYVSYNVSGDIACFNLDGTGLTSYRNSKEFREPGKVIGDKHGNIYVCSLKANTVHQFTSSCSKIRILLTQSDGLNEPFAISFSEQEKQLIVGSRTGNAINVYRTILGTD